MAKRKTKREVSTGAKRKTPQRVPGTAATRSKIARLDQQLVRLVQKRAELVLASAKILSRNVAQPPSAVLGDSAQPRAAVPQAVPDVLGVDEELLAADGQGPLPKHCLRAVLQEVASGCRGLIHEPRIAFVGPLYSLGHLAAIHCFGQSVNLVPVGSVAAVFEEVCRKQSDFGMAPMEDSTDGRVADTLDMLVRTGVRICGEVEMKIHHVLLGKCPRTEVREVYSRPEALAQCRNWLAKHLPTARTIEMTSTATAAQLACEKPGAAAIACLQAGRQYALETLAENIEDNSANTTRFAVVGEHAPPRTGNDRTAMLFQVDHRPGALADAMAIFKRNRLNLTRIESFPIAGPEPGYSFFVEMEGHQSDARMRRATAALGRKTLRLEILGSFPASAPLE
jgi:chorismate mutase / prephenate dehydratase